METKTYLFQPDKKFLKQGFFMTDESGNVTYEAKMVKQSFFGPVPFQFINHLTNKTEDHKIGHTITTQTENGSMIFDEFSKKSYFKLDGKNVWDFLHELGVRIDSHFEDRKIGMKYEISLEGKPIAHIETTSPKGKSMITSRYYFNVTTTEEYLDLVFLVTFSIARTEQTFYN